MQGEEYQPQVDNDYIRHHQISLINLKTKTYEMFILLYILIPQFNTVSSQFQNIL